MSDPLDKSADHSIGKEIDAFLTEMLRETDRGCVLVGTSMVDNALAGALKAVFKSLSSVTEAELKDLLANGMRTPLGSFAARALTAYAIGVIDRPVFLGLGTVRKMRNHAAHIAEPVAFDRYDWKALFASLGPGIEEFFSRISAMPANPPLSPARIQFMATVFFVWIGLKRTAESPGRGLAPAQEIDRLFSEQLAKRKQDGRWPMPP